MCCSERLLLDTNIFNSVCDGKIDVSLFNGWALCAIPVQREELRETKDPIRRNTLLNCFHDINPEMRKTETFAWDISGAGWDEAEWTKPDGLFDKIHAALKVEDQKDRRKRKMLVKNPANCFHDALIAEVAIRNGISLITNDPSLLNVVPRFGGKALSLAEFSTLKPQ